MALSGPTSVTFECSDKDAQGPTTQSRTKLNLQKLGFLISLSHRSVRFAGVVVESLSFSMWGWQSIQSNPGNLLSGDKDPIRERHFVLFTSFREMSVIHCNITANRAGQDYLSVKHWVRTVSDLNIAFRFASNRGTEWLLSLWENCIFVEALLV